jgi:alpha-D-ribose 1-methylphosphonate 5-triphosphate diphosphatase PhnM
VLGLTDRGRIAPGMRADLVALDPESLGVRAVWLGGELAVGSAELR